MLAIKEDTLNSWYNPLVGRFLSEDPIGFRSGDFNNYRYVNNNPINFADPSGLKTDGMGISLNLNAFGLGVTAEISYVTDDEGGRGFSFSGGAGAVVATPGGSITFETQHTNAPVISNLSEFGSQTGGSIFVGPGIGVGGGSEIITSGNYVGVTTNYGVGIVGGGFSVIPTWTKIIQTTQNRKKGSGAGSGGVCGSK